jgi:phosphoribosylaminoimidazolecarboxamide formyltransferase/IMP cyclohydrolase
MSQEEHDRYALISVSDKTGIVQFAGELTALGYEVVSTGGTARALQAAGIAVTSVECLTGMAEMLDGRVKTLHPAVHGGILFRRDLRAHRDAAAEAQLPDIAIVCVNLYPFAQTVESGGAVEECIENIDIGGPAMIRSAAKNHADVAVVTDPADYSVVVEELRVAGVTSIELRRRLAAKAFAMTAAYDAEIADWMRTYAGLSELPARYSIGGTLAYRCRYGENPHQWGAFYRQIGAGEPCIGHATVLGGKELSYNNLCDADAALEAAKELDDQAACVIVKHTNPCGAAVAPTLAEAFRGALGGDPVSAFGGIVAFTRPLDASTAELMTAPGAFFEVVVAPGFDPDAVETLTTRRKWGASVRLLSVPDLTGWRAMAKGCVLRQLTGGFVVQDRDLKLISEAETTVVTKRAPTADEMRDLLFGWRLVRHVKSNAIVLAAGGRVVGVGAGQMNRVQSVRLAVGQAGDRASGAVMASDAFFPFADGPEVAALAGVTAIIQPGGSKRDADTVAVCDAHDIAMVYTGMRHFRH